MILGLQDKITFGKYKGKTVNWIIKREDWEMKLKKWVILGKMRNGKMQLNSLGEDPVSAIPIPTGICPIFDTKKQAENFRNTTPVLCLEIRPCYIVI